LILVLTLIAVYVSIFEEIVEVVKMEFVENFELY